MFYVFISFLVFFVFIILLVVYLIFKTKLSKINKKIVDYKTISQMCSDIGFSQQEIVTFLEMIRKSYLKPPYFLFTELKQLDKLLKKQFEQISNLSNLSEQDIEKEKNILFEIKAKIERNFRGNLGLKSSEFISTGQKMIIGHKDKKYFAIVTNNIPSYIKFKFLSEKLDKSLIEKELNNDDKVIIFFWRDNDANYTFTSRLMINKNKNFYAIKHSKKLNRAQKRKYIRITVNLAAKYQELSLNQVKGEESIEYNNLSDCRVVNISAGGLKFKSQTHNWRQFDEKIKEKFFFVEFYLAEQRITIIGKMVRMHLFETGQVILTLKHEKVRNKDKNIINQCIYDYL